jgi:hypothetical protein
MSDQFGPSGGVGGNAFHDPMPAGDFKILEIRGRSSARIDRIEVVWEKDDGEPDPGDPHGSATAGQEFTLAIGKGDIYLVKIEGTLVVYNNSVRVSWLRMYSTAGLIGETGTANANYPFVFECPENYQITGIFGRAESGLDALGVYIAPIKP